MRDRIFNIIWENNSEDAADAIIAALPDLVSELVWRDSDVSCWGTVARLRLAPEVAEAEADPSPFFKDCTIDLRGAGYNCVARDGGVRLAVYGEGDLVLCEGGKVTAIGLHILGPVALKEKIEAAVTAALEAAAAKP